MNSPINISTFVSIVFGVCLVAYPAGAWIASDGDPVTARRTLDRTHAQRLAHLAQECDADGHLQLGQYIRNWAIDRDPRRQYLFVVDRFADPAILQDEVQHQWFIRFLELRKQYARELFQHAQLLLDVDQPFEAQRILYEVLYQDPGHADARVKLGYKKVVDRWCLPYAARQVSRGQVNDHRFGWLRGSDIERYEMGHRRYRGRWISAVRDTQRHSRIDQGWRIETEHYLITTNHSLEAGVALGRQLEDFYSVWQQIFASFYWSKDSLERRLKQTHLLPVHLYRKHRVTFFRSRDEYISALRDQQPRISMTLGIYLARSQTAYFFADDKRFDATLHHEAAHQLFHEVGMSGNRLRHAVGLEQNFWIVEGIALYMESLQVHERYHTTGGIDAHRLQFARHNLLVEGFYVPLNQLVAMGREGLQSDQRIRVLYSQAAGLTHLLMDDQGGRFQEALMRYIKSVYRVRDDPNTLAMEIGLSNNELDKQYRQFLNVSDDDLKRCDGLQYAERLLLGRTDVTDGGIQFLSVSSGLQDLNLQGTRITNQTLEIISGCVQLQELDLSETSIGDPGLGHLEKLKMLKVLSCRRTPISDAGLPHLESLNRLEQLDLSESNVTSDGLAYLRAQLPKLK